MREAGGERLFESGCWVSEWHVQPSRNRIASGDGAVGLEPKVMQVLVCLIRRAGETVTKEQFMEEVWADTVVTDDVLARCISELRSALGDDARDPTYIETIRKTGYRLIASVAHEAPAAPGAGASAASPPAGDRADERRALPVPVESPGPGHRLFGGRRRFQLLLRRLGRRLRPMPLWSVAVLLVACTVAGTLLLQRALPDGAPAAPDTVPFTSFPGEEFDAALSPDGGRVAFVWNGGEGESHDIYVMQSGTSTPLRVTVTEHADERSPTWAPDGERLAFVRTSEEGNRIVVVPAVGGSERVVARFGERRVRSLVWGPDGQMLAFSAQPAPYEAYSLYLLSVETLDMRRLTAPPGYYRGDFAPTFSPDGRKIAFTRSLFERIEDVYVVSVKGGVPRRLTNDQARVTGLEWTDGGGILFASNRNGTSEIWRMAPAGGTPTLVTGAGSGRGLYQPSVARGGQRMTVTQRSVDVNIWTLRRLERLDGFTSHVRIISTRWDSSPDVSPDGDRLVFVSKRSGHFEIWTSRHDGTEPKQLTHFGGPVTGRPRWSPDGGRIAFVSRPEGSADIFISDAAGGAPRRLTTGASEEVAPSWSRDGQWVYFGSNRTGRWQIWKRPADGSGSAVQVTKHGGFAAFEGPDGEMLYYVRHDAPGIWKLPLNETAKGEEQRDVEPVRVVEALEPYDWGNWAVAGGGIYFVRRRGERPVLAYYGFAADRTYAIAYLREEVPRHPSLAVAPGGDWFLYAKVDRSESDIMIVENFR